MNVAHEQVTIASHTFQNSPVLSKFRFASECAKKRTEIDLQCQFLGLSRRHAAQRFRRWRDKQKVAK